VDDITNAIECAMELHRRVSELRRKGLRLELAIGVHQGEVTVSRAPGHRVRYVARGNTTRLARRLSAAADHGETVVSERVMELAEGAFLMVKGPTIGNRGGKPPLASLLVEGRRSGLRIASRGPWVRRGKELEVLRTGLVTLSRGDGAAVVLTGGVGAGKSRFIREIRELANRRGIPFYGARCAARQALRPMHGFTALIRQILGIRADVHGEAASPYLERLAQLGLSPRDLQAIGTLFGIRPRHAPDRGEIWRAVARTFQGLAREGPCIVALDDVQELSDGPSAQLARMVSEASGVPVMWLLSGGSAFRTVAVNSS
jgi:hypothetical protein